MYVEIDDEVYSSFDDELKGKLKVYEPEDTSGLKNKANDLLAELKASQATLAEKEAELKKAKLKPSDAKSGELQAQLDDALVKIDGLNSEIAGLNSTIEKGHVQSEAQKLASSLTKDSAKAGLLAEKFTERLKFEGDSLMVLTSDGKPTVSKPEELAAEIKERYPFLVDGRKSAGGEGLGDAGGASKTTTNGSGQSTQAVQNLAAKIPGFSQLPVK